MATYYAKPSEMTAFPGGSNEIISIVANDLQRPVIAPSFVSVSAQGFTFDQATIGVRGFGSATYDEHVVSEPKTNITIGESGGKIAAIKISGLPAGAYFLTFLAGK